METIPPVTPNEGKTVPPVTPDEGNGKSTVFGWFVILIIFLLFGLLPSVLINTYKEKIKATIGEINTVQTDCYSFKLPTGFTDVEENESDCHVDLRSDDSSVKQAVRVFPVTTDNTLIEKDMETLVKFEIEEVLKDPSLNVVNESEIEYLGLNGYGARATGNGAETVIYYLLLPSTNNTSDIKAYAIGFASDGNIDDLIDEVENSWKWSDNISSKVSEQSSSVTDSAYTINSPCFTFTSQVTVTKHLAVDECSFSVQLGGDSDIVNIHEFSTSNSSLDTEVNFWKEHAGEYVIISEEPMTVDAKNSHKIVFKTSPESDVTQIIVFVYTGNAYETSFGHPVSGFQINSLYDVEINTKANLDYILSHWNWL